MGRPINQNFIGNTTGSSQTLAMTAWIPGDVGPCTGYAIRQKTSNGYNAGNVAGPSSGLVFIVNGGVALTQGSANITVTPYGSTGTGATATANLGVYSATANVAGTGTTANWYTPGEILIVSGGTETKTGNILVEAVGIGAVAIGTPAGPGYTVGDTFTWGEAGFSPSPVLTVATVTGNGNISGVTITNAGLVTNVSVTNTTPFTSTTQTNAWATGATFTNRWDIKQTSITARGDYSVAPTNSVSLTGSAHGTGATANLTWQVASVHVNVPGHGYQAVAVNFSNSTAQALGTVNAAGNVSAITVTAPGFGLSTSPPSVTISTIRNVEYAQKITNLVVETFQGNTYVWVASNVTPVDGQAQLQTA